MIDERGDRPEAVWLLGQVWMLKNRALRYSGCETDIADAALERIVLQADAERGRFGSGAEMGEWVDQALIALMNDRDARVFRIERDRIREEDRRRPGRYVEFR
ncbi:MAG: hypothetical protein VW600_01450 [Ferrovibrio sp.]